MGLGGEEVFMQDMMMPTLLHCQEVSNVLLGCGAKLDYVVSQPTQVGSDVICCQGSHLGQ